MNQYLQHIYDILQQIEDLSDEQRKAIEATNFALTKSLEDLKAAQGTGLGLSLAYDIVKAHGGELKVETRESEGAEFVIILPVTNNKNI